MFLAGNAEKKRFEHPKQLDPPKAKHWENRLKKKDIFKGYLSEQIKENITQI